MDIKLRKHEDGSYVLEVREKELRREIDITHIIREIFLTKLNDLQTKVRLEERYRNWVTEAVQKNSTALSTARSRYSAMSHRLKDTDKAIECVEEEWKSGNITSFSMKELSKVKGQNENFLEHDDTLRKISDE